MAARGLRDNEKAPSADAMCGHSVWDNDNGATTIGKKLGFTSATRGSISASLPTVAIADGKCKAGDEPTSCTTACNAFGTTSAANCNMENIQVLVKTLCGIIYCRASNAVGIKVACQDPVVPRESLAHAPASAPTSARLVDAYSSDDSAALIERMPCRLAPSGVIDGLVAFVLGDLIFGPPDEMEFKRYSYCRRGRMPYLGAACSSDDIGAVIDGMACSLAPLSLEDSAVECPLAR